MIINILYFIFQITLLTTFSSNGLDITTWQFWTLFIGINTSHFLGMLRMVD